MKPHERIIVALDGINEKDHLAHTAAELAPHVGMVKMNDVLDAYGGAELVREFAPNISVFADAKIIDIPNTVYNRVRQYADAGAKFVTVMALGGREMLLAAVRATEGSETHILAVTVLTSLSPNDCNELYGDLPGPKVMQLARDAKNCGVHGIVCSPKELALLGRHEAYENLIKVTPGIRPAWAAANDQKRVTTPGEAVRAGADYLVIGRPILKPPREIGYPAQAAQKIAEEIAGMLA